MTNLADAVLDFLWFLEFSEDDECDPDLAIKHLESLSLDIENNWTDDEKEMLSDAANRRLIGASNKDQTGHIPSVSHSAMSDEQKGFLEAIAAGRFNGQLEDDDDYTL